jgi:hypothetical protein
MCPRGTNADLGEGEPKENEARWKTGSLASFSTPKPLSANLHIDEIREEVP